MDNINQKAKWITDNRNQKAKQNNRQKQKPKDHMDN